MTFTIVGCGQTASDWIPRGTSIGVNDCWKWGKPTDALLVCNRPQEFGIERLKVITSSKPKTFYTHKKLAVWSFAFQNIKRLRLQNWDRNFIPRMDRFPLEERVIYSSNTVSFIALSLCYQLGATEIIMWGVDFVNHNTFHTDNPETAKEVNRHLELIAALKEQGVNVWLGKEGTAFDGRVPVYNPVVMETFQNIKDFCDFKE